MRIWIKAVIVLGIIWAVVLTALWFVQKAKPTPEKLISYIEEHPIENLSGAEREKVILTVVEKVNRLDFAQRRQMQTQGGKLRKMFQQLSPEEQSDFLDKTLPAGFRELMVALNRMSPAQRERMVKRALEDMQEDRMEGDRPFSIDDPHIKKMIENGMESFYRDASIETKMDFAPVIEAIQAKAQKIR